MVRYPVCCSAEPELSDMGSVSHRLPPLGFPPAVLTPGLFCQFVRKAASSQIASLAITAKAIVVFIRH